MENKALDCAGESTTDKNFDKPISTSQHCHSVLSVAQISVNGTCFQRKCLTGLELPFFLLIIFFGIYMCAVCMAIQKGTSQTTATKKLNSYQGV